MAIYLWISVIKLSSMLSEQKHMPDNNQENIKEISVFCGLCSVLCILYASNIMIVPLNGEQQSLATDNWQHICCQTYYIRANVTGVFSVHCINIAITHSWQTNNISSKENLRAKLFSQ